MFKNTVQCKTWNLQIKQPKERNTIGSSRWAKNLSKSQKNILIFADVLCCSCITACWIYFFTIKQKWDFTTDMLQSFYRPWPCQSFKSWINDQRRSNTVHNHFYFLRGSCTLRYKFFSKKTFFFSEQEDSTSLTISKSYFETILLWSLILDLHWN